MRMWGPAPLPAIDPLPMQNTNLYRSEPFVVFRRELRDQINGSRRLVQVQLFDGASATPARATFDGASATPAGAGARRDEDVEHIDGGDSTSITAAATAGASGVGSGSDIQVRPQRHLATL